ncbi:MAG TPA: hypothetical protein VHP11_13540 [Tepidisphaeraceae bacterium]|nr:hypothetical protein [Tepidisphaeraceae bacterium]
MKVKLDTDFLDYYDHHFDREGIPFHRLASFNFSRPEMLRILQEEMGSLVPRHGIGKDTIISSADLGAVWVVHRDLRAHRGEGKVLCSGHGVLELYPQAFVVQYIAADSHSFRYLQIGNRAFWLSYHSQNDWRSNVGDVKVLCLGETKPTFIKPKWSLFAIDYVVNSSEGPFYAIDLNTAPGLTGTGIEKLLPPTVAAQLIKDALDPLV